MVKVPDPPWGSPWDPLSARGNPHDPRAAIEELFAGSLRSGPLAVVGSRCTMESTPATTKTTEMTGASSITVVNAAQAVQVSSAPEAKMGLLAAHVAALMM